MDYAHLAGTLSRAFEELSTASSVAHELGRDRILDPALANRIKATMREVANIYAQLPTGGR